ncbi:hypothetical protein GTG28_20020 [Vibrio sp. OCN044]|uniref:Uncharacterized protein n=1 Tax=Vibrio tetraodonis subsp. pristinus TaxID=2695891 RepID=A0A6L8LZG4_9VIBR|nr:hypothetical protein [Vibrio tetraodonis]MYM61498.1 hypothetical protein [Vibrio tetraodonis subsp. pristinus]
MLSFDLSLIPEVDNFFSSVHKYTVEEFGATYTAFYHESQKTKNKLFWISESSWGKVYVERDYIKDCHLFNFGRSIMKKKSYICFPWNHIKEETKKQKEISGIRREHNIDHGLSFANLKYNCITGLNFNSFTQNRIFTKEILNDFTTISAIRNEIFRYSSKYNMIMHKDRINIFDVLSYSKNIIPPSASFLHEDNRALIHY